MICRSPDRHLPSRERGLEVEFAASVSASSRRAVCTDFGGRVYGLSQHGIRDDARVRGIHRREDDDRSITEFWILSKELQQLPARRLWHQEDAGENESRGPSVVQEIHGCGHRVGSQHRITGLSEGDRQYIEDISVVVNEKNGLRCSYSLQRCGALASWSRPSAGTQES